MEKPKPKNPDKNKHPPPNKPPTKQTTTKNQTLISGIKEAQGLKALPPSLTTTVQSLGLTRRTTGLPKGSSDPGAHALPRSHLPVHTRIKKKIFNKLNQRVRAAAIMTATLSITKIRKRNHSGHGLRLTLGQPALTEELRVADLKCRASPHG